MTTDPTTHRQRQILLFLTGVVLFHDPFLSLLRVELSVGSVPVLPVALFVIWMSLIGGAWRMARETSPDRTDAAPLSSSVPSGSAPESSRTPG